MYYHACTEWPEEEWEYGAGTYYLSKHEFYACEADRAVFLKLRFGPE